MFHDKEIEGKWLGIEFVPELTNQTIHVVAILFVDDTSMVEGAKAKSNMQKISKTHNALDSATGSIQKSKNANVLLGNISGKKVLEKLRISQSN